MRIVVYSLLWEMQSLYHQPYDMQGLCQGLMLGALLHDSKDETKGHQATTGFVLELLKCLHRNLPGD